jgi:ankyrin repeat protein
MERRAAAACCLIFLFAVAASDIVGEVRDSMALISVVRAGDVASAKLLLEFGVNPNILDGHGLAALHYAVSANNVAMVKALLDDPRTDVDIVSGGR